VISNHQSWVDIPALIQALNRRTPFFKFFLKKELVWVPFLGLAWWALDYPFMKRYTYYPQVVLGAAFSWGMPMAFTAETGNLPAAAWLLYIANVLWTVGYDTYYAMTDRDDDLKIGVKSTAILFGDADRAIILTLQGLALACLLLAGAPVRAGRLVPPGVAGGGGLFCLGILVHPGQGPDEVLQGVFAQPLGRVGDLCRGLSRITAFDEGPGPSSRGPN